MKISRDNLYLVFIVLIAALLIFCNIGTRDVNEWDEARNGQNAYEMYHNHDYINLYYGGVQDTWNAKPPLMIWLIVLCYKAFGFNEFALRLPAAVSTILFFIYLYRLIRLFDHENVALLSCLVLMSCKAIIGWHIGLNGDFDALLLFFLTVSAYHFIQFIDFGRENSILYAALFTGLAFYTKGTASLLYIPGCLIYAYARGKPSVLFKSYKTWLAVMLFILIASSWFYLVLIHGMQSSQSHYETSNALETMLVFDTYKRLTDTQFDGKEGAHGLGVFLQMLDVRLNIWIYLFYITIAGFIIKCIKNKIALKEYLRKFDNGLICFAIFQMLIIGSLLILATNPHDWYAAPIFGFFAYIIIKTTVSIWNHYKSLKWLLYLILSFCLIRHYVYISTLDSSLHSLFNNNLFVSNAEPIIIINTPKQNAQLYLTWQKKDYILTDIENYTKYSDHLLLLDNAFDKANIRLASPIASSKDYSLYLLK